MRILQVHNFYLQRGGEEVVLDHERALLESNGNRVDRFTTDSADIGTASTADRLRAGLENVWSGWSYRRLLARLKADRPDVVHVHNPFPLLGPSIYWAARRAGVPLVQTLHNYRLTCANALLVRDGAPCEACVGQLPIAALRHRCYRDSLPATAALLASARVHSWLGTYRRKIDAYICLTEFARDVWVRAGLPAERVFVKPNFVPSSPGRPQVPRKNQIVFVGRLADYKGVDLLLEAWSRLRPAEWSLTIVGDGPERQGLCARFDGLANVQWRGWLAPADVLREIASSRFLVVASRAYEMCPMVLLEAFSAGTPAIAPRLSGFPEIVRPGAEGFLFAPGSAESLAESLAQALALEPAAWEALGARALLAYREKYSPEASYRQLLGIYRFATASRDLTKGRRNEHRGHPVAEIADVCDARRKRHARMPAAGADHIDRR